MGAIVARDYPRVTWWCPALPPSPRLAVEHIMDGIADWPATLAVVGSSLGGFYATWVAQQRACKAVLLNPAVDPARDLQKYIGEQTAWHRPGETFYFQSGFVDELRALQAGPLTSPQNFMAVIAKGDEVLSWREMAGRYAGASIRLLEGGDHALSDFDDHVPAILEFLDPVA